MDSKPSRRADNWDGIERRTVAANRHVPRHSNPVRREYVSHRLLPDATKRGRPRTDSAVRGQLARTDAMTELIFFCIGAVVGVINAYVIFIARGKA